MSHQIAVRLADEALAGLDATVASGRYASRAAAVRAGVECVLAEERERQIADAYRRGYEQAPQEERVGEAGLAFMAEVLRDEPPPRIR
jgi:Arc/MetJ-type ribon-helix-helix transcriptional regulator